MDYKRERRPPPFKEFSFNLLYVILWAKKGVNFALLLLLLVEFFAEFSQIWCINIVEDSKLVQERNSNTAPKQAHRQKILKLSCLFIALIFY